MQYGLALLFGCLFGAVAPLYAENVYPVVVQLHSAPKVLIEDSLMESAKLHISERQAKALQSEVRRARYSGPAVELLGKISSARDGFGKSDIRYDGENLALGTLFFQVNRQGEAFIKAQTSVKQVLSATSKNLSKQP